MSACSITGSMMDMVKNAKEVRRLIRAGSFDSTGSDISIGEFSLNEDLGASTAVRLERLADGVDQIKDNCGSIEDGIDQIPYDTPRGMAASRSTAAGLAEFCRKEEDGK